MLFKDYFISQRWPSANPIDSNLWFENMRLHGLDYFQQMPANFTVLDIGCAEGFVSSKFGEWGAKTVHGIDHSSERIDEAKKLTSDTTTFEFTNYYLTSQESFTFNDTTYTGGTDTFVYDNEWLLDEYDIVLMMSSFHTFDQKVMDLLLTLTKTYFVYRGEAANEYKEYLLQNGFQVVLDDDLCPNKIFKK